MQWIRNEFGVGLLAMSIQAAMLADAPVANDQEEAAPTHDAAGDEFVLAGPSSRAAGNAERAPVSGDATAHLISLLSVAGAGGRAHHDLLLI